ncbi:hypothetical protein ACTHGU_01415 [Chitinophagaceae bacterium MMS25-I14]
MKKITFSLFAVAAALNFSSCSKESASKHAGCRLVSAISDTGIFATTYKIKYNNQGKPSQVTYGSMIENFTYGNGYMTVQYFQNTAPVGKDSMLLNAQGSVTYVTGTSPLSSAQPSFISFTYNADGTLATRVQQEPGQPNDTITYQWQNGDLITSTEWGIPTSYLYDQAKPAGNGDFNKFWDIVSFGAGTTITTKHFTMGTSNNPITNVVTDSLGNVTSYTVNGQLTKKYVFSYDCQ